MDLDQVTLAQMRYAVAVEGAQSFRLAASQCHVSQSGLSMQVRKLEELLGVVLFDRSKKPVIVTPEGETALAQMRAVLRETERLGQIVAEEDEPSGRYRLGVIPTLSPTVLPLFLADFVDLHPRVELVVEELKTEEIIARLQADTLDAGLAATPLDVPGLAEEPLGDELMYAYLPERDPLLREAAVSQMDLRERELWVMPEGHCFRSQVLAYCSADRPREPRRIHFESGSFQTLIRLVDAGLGATVLPALVVAGLSDATRRAQVRPLVAPTPVREIGLVTARADLRRRVSDALVAIARRRLSEALAPPPEGAVTLAPIEPPRGGQPPMTRRPARPRDAAGAGADHEHSLRKLASAPSLLHGGRANAEERNHVLKRMLMTTLIIAGAATTARAGDADGSWWGSIMDTLRARAAAHRAAEPAPTAPSAGRSAAAERICAHPASGDLRTVCDELDALRASLDARLAAESRARQEAEKKLQALTRGGVAEDLQ